MVTAPNTLPKKLTWQQALSDASITVAQLCQRLSLSPEAIGTDTICDEISALHFPLVVTESFIQRMEIGNPNDPLLRQVLPTHQERQITPGYTTDPVGERDANPAPGLLHKYHGRVLLTLTGFCAINCRYCFRRHFPYEDNTPGRDGWDAALDYINHDTSISEVIYSGGDPLLQKDEVLNELTQRIAAIPHVKRLRVHTRLPIVLPERMTTECMNALTHPNLKTVLVMHCNHPNEINQAVRDAAKRCCSHGMSLLNQSVLLRGVNDDVDILANLSEQLFEIGVLPYYLHCLDKVQGAAHFDVPLDQALALHATLRTRLPGYLLPNLVREVAGEKAKLPALLLNH